MSVVVNNIRDMFFLKKQSNENEAANSWMHKSSIMSGLYSIQFVTTHVHLQQMHTRQSLNV